MSILERLVNEYRGKMLQLYHDSAKYVEEVNEYCDNNSGDFALMLAKSHNEENMALLLATMYCNRNTKNIVKAISILGQQDCDNFEELFYNSIDLFIKVYNTKVEDINTDLTWIKLFDCYDYSIQDYNIDFVKHILVALGVPKDEINADKKQYFLEREKRVVRGSVSWNACPLNFDPMKDASSHTDPPDRPPESGDHIMDHEEQDKASHTTGPKPFSYRDSLMGCKGRDFNGVASGASYMDEDPLISDLLDQTWAVPEPSEEVKKLMEIYPSLTVSEDEYNEACTPWNNSLTITVLGTKNKANRS